MINMEDMRNMPAIPDLFYRSEWKGWNDFLNTQYPYDWKKIEIIKFNYNGKGDAIALCDDRLTYIHQVDLDLMLFGDQYGSIHFDVLTSGIGTGFILKQSRQSKESIMVSDIPKTKTKPKPKPKPKRKSSKNVQKTKNKK